MTRETTSPAPRTRKRESYSNYIPLFYLLVIDVQHGLSRASAKKDARRGCFVRPHGSPWSRVSRSDAQGSWTHIVQLEDSSCQAGRSLRMIYPPRRDLSRQTMRRRASILIWRILVAQCKALVALIISIRRTTVQRLLRVVDIAVLRNRILVHPSVVYKILYHSSHLHTHNERGNSG